MTGFDLHLVAGLAPRLDIRVEGAAAKNQVGDQREIGHEHQRQGPGDRALGGSDGQHRMNRGEGPKKVQRGDEVGEQVRAKEIHGRRYSRQSNA